ncbi:hypothetical protein GCM10009681_37670 [Luedemannella helvata]|uniref:CBM2 domain-containing protein n=1 Tax=Luedemannella helvata TaxID=349315 RepID=A0ABP4WXX9_9ACTN
MARLGCALAATACAAAFVVQPAHAVPVTPAAAPGVPASVRDAMRAQVPLVAAANAIKAAVEATDQKGYAGIGLTGDHVTLWWKGRLPATVASAVSAARGVAPVVVATAAHSRTELRAAARTARAATAGSGAEIKLAADGSGLLLAVDPKAAAPATPTVDVPVKVVRQARLKPRSRDDDTPLWRGGTIMWNGPGCTAGFGVKDAAGATYILTAAHCGQVGSTWTDGAGETIGTLTARNQPHDVALISTPVAGNTVYTGGINDEQQAVVSGSTEVYPGQLLCQSGRTMAANTGGPMCNIEVRFHYTDEEDLVEATQLDGLEVAYSGDSGGPVYALGPDNTILAAGTLTRSGGAGLGFQDFATARDDFGVEPLTGTTTTACHVTYSITNSWSDGFNGSVTIHNSGPAVSAWKLGWTFSGPGNQVVNGAWNTTVTQTDQRVTAENVGHNATIPSGGSVTFGFNASGPATTPGLFTLNGSYCV